MTSLRRRLVFVVTAFVAAGSLAATAAPATPEPATLQAVSVDGAHLLPGGLRLSVTGKLTCTKNAHFHLNLMILERTQGALAKGALPAKLPLKPTAAMLARSKAVSACSGVEQPWSLVAIQSAKHPLPFAAGTASACVTVTVKKGSGYSDLQQACSTVPVA